MDTITWIYKAFAGIALHVKWDECFWIKRLLLEHHHIATYFMNEALASLGDVSAGIGDRKPLLG